MSPLLDPTLCPECRSLLDEQATCTGCGLRLTGPLAGQLWQTMQRAAALVEALRRQPALSPSFEYAAPPPAQPAVPRRRLPGGSVPVVLFVVGGLCLLVAAVVFVAVAWSSLGLGARTTILLGVTLAIGATASTLTRRGLRGAAETFWLITALLVTIDLVAAYGAGLLGFDAMPARHAAATAGAVLLSLGLGASLFVRGTALRVLHGMTAVATAGALGITTAEAWTLGDDDQRPLATVVAIIVATGVAALARQMRLAGPAYGFGAVAVLGWVVLVGNGAERADGIALRSWWTQLHAWPLLVAAGLAAAVTAARRLPEPVRMAGAGACLAVLGLAALLPQAGQDTRFVLAVAVLLALAGVTAGAPRTWSAPAGLLTAVALVPLATLTLIRPILAAAGLPSTAPAHRTNLHLSLPSSEIGLSGWTAVLGAAGIAVAVLALTRWLETGHRPIAIRTWTALAPVVLSIGVGTAVLETSPALMTAVGVWAGLLLLTAVLAALVRGGWTTPVLLTAGYLIAVGFRLALPSHLLLALLATGVTAGLAVGYRRTAASPVVRVVLAVVAVLAAGTAASQWPSRLGGGQDAAAIAVVLVAVGIGLLAPLIARQPGDREYVELTALVLALGACAIPADVQLTSVLLTVTGTATALTSVLHRDRDQVAWVGTLVLGGATLIRIDASLSLPELASAPAAALLLAAGYRRMLLDPEAGSRRALGSGLTLALLPTLLLVVDDPVSVRSVVLGTVAALFVAVGIAERWSAPFLAGAAALAVLAVVHLGPVAGALPRWISLGALGVALLVVAVTWEQRRQNLASAERYLDALR